MENSTGRVRKQHKIWPIEERMRADMAARGYTPMTQRIYVRGVRHLSRHYAWRNPELISGLPDHDNGRPSSPPRKALSSRGPAISTTARHLSRTATRAAPIPPSAPVNLLNPYTAIPAACPEPAEAACSTQGCSSRYGDVLTLSMFG